VNAKAFSKTAGLPGAIDDDVRSVPQNFQSFGGKIFLSCGMIAVRSRRKAAACFPV